MQQQYDHDHDGPKLKKDRQYNGESKKDKKKNNDLQNATGKHKHKKGGELRCSGRVSRPCSTSDTRSANFYLPFIDAKSHHCFIFFSGDWFSSDIWTDFMHHYQTGYNDCIREILRYMTDVEGLKVNDERCVRLMSYLQTRFHPDASVTSGSAYRQLKNVHRFTPFRSPYPIIDDIPHGDRHMTHSPRFRPYDFSIRPNTRHSDGILTAKPITDCSPFSVLTSYGEVFRSTERQNSFNKFGNSK
jgi:hypothetical protein